MNVEFNQEIVKEISNLKIFNFHRKLEIKYNVKAQIEEFWNKRSLLRFHYQIAVFDLNFSFLFQLLDFGCRHFDDFWFHWHYCFDSW